MWNGHEKLEIEQGNEVLKRSVWILRQITENLLPRSYISTGTTPRASPPDNFARSISSVKDNILAETAQLAEEARQAVDAQLVGLKRQCEERPKQLAALHHFTVKQGFLP